MRRAVTGRLARPTFSHVHDAANATTREAVVMELDGYAVLALLIGLAVLLDLAALRWGVDSRFADVRSDLLKR